VLVRLVLVSPFPAARLDVTSGNNGVIPCAIFVTEMLDDIGESRPEACVGAGANPGLCTEVFPAGVPIFLASGTQITSPFCVELRSALASP
jgi:hypothetical protein